MGTRNNRWGWPWHLGALVLVACGVAVGYRVIQAQPGVTEENYNRVEQGMTLGQVRAILGPENAFISPVSVDEIGGEYEYELQWWADAVTITVRFQGDPGRGRDTHDVVSDKAFKGTWYGR